LKNPALTDHHLRTIAAVWPRFIAWRVAADLGPPVAVDLADRRRLVQRAALTGELPTSFWRSALEPVAFDLAVPDDWEPRPARRATTTPPNTAQRVEVYARRVAAGIDLYHPADATAVDGGVPVREAYHRREFPA